MHNENVTQEHKKHGNIRICFAEILVQLLGAGLDNLSVLLLPLGVTVFTNIEKAFS